MRMLTISLALAAGVATAQGAPPQDPPQRVELEPVAPPAEGMFGHLSFTLRPPWLQGAFELRFPETLASSLGLHFIDHDRADMRPLSMPDPFPGWTRNPETGEIRYTHRTPEGVEMFGRARPYRDEVHLEFAVTNRTGENIERVNHQMCLVMTRAAGFGRQNTLENACTWIDGRFTPLTRTTPTPDEKNRRPWILMLTRERAADYRGAREWRDGWWVVDQVADHGIIARVSEDGGHLIAIVWDETPHFLMTNTWIPCLHAGPTGAVSIAPGATHTWRGRIYLMENEPERLLQRTRGDFPTLFNRE